MGASELEKTINESTMSLENEFRIMLVNNGFQIEELYAKHEVPKKLPIHKLPTHPQQKKRYEAMRNEVYGIIFQTLDNYVDEVGGIFKFHYETWIIDEINSQLNTNQNQASMNGFFSNKNFRDKLSQTKLRRAVYSNKFRKEIETESGILSDSYLYSKHLFYKDETKIHKYIRRINEEKEVNPQKSPTLNLIKPNLKTFELSDDSEILPIGSAHFYLIEEKNIPSEIVPQILSECKFGNYYLNFEGRNGIKPTFSKSQLDDFSNFYNEQKI